jgi:hypothetical protein
MTSIDRRAMDAVLTTLAPNGINLSALTARDRRGLSRHLDQPFRFTNYTLVNRTGVPVGTPVDLCKLIRYICAGFGNKHTASCDVAPVSE